MARYWRATDLNIAGGLYDRTAVPKPESYRAKAFSKCTQLPLVGAFAKTPTMPRKALGKHIDIYLGFEILLSTWIASRYYS